MGIAFGIVTGICEGLIGAKTKTKATPKVSQHSQLKFVNILLPLLIFHFIIPKKPMLLEMITINGINFVALKMFNPIISKPQYFIITNAIKHKSIQEAIQEPQQYEYIKLTLNERNELILYEFNDAGLDEFLPDVIINIINKYLDKSINKKTLISFSRIKRYLTALEIHTCFIAIYLVPFYSAVWLGNIIGKLSKNLVKSCTELSQEKIEAVGTTGQIFIPYVGIGISSAFGIINIIERPNLKTIISTTVNIGVSITATSFPFITSMAIASDIAIQSLIDGCIDDK